MKRGTVRLVNALVFCVGFSALAIAGEIEPKKTNTITLKAEVYVKGPQVYLSDVAEIEGDAATALADIELFGAAAPGRAKRLDATLLKARLERAGIDSDSFALTGARTVLTRTMYLEVSRESVAEALRKYILSAMPWDAEDASIDVLSSGVDMIVPDGNFTIAWRSNPQYRWVGNGAFRGEVSVDGEYQRTVIAKANIEAFVGTLIAIHEIRRGQLIRASDLALEKRSLSRLKHAPLDDPEAVAGFLARSTIFSGEAIAGQDLQPRKLVKRNQLVSVKTRIGALLVQGRARALIDGHAGDLITLQNPQSKREFTGVVGPDGIVVVE